MAVDATGAGFEAVIVAEILVATVVGGVGIEGILKVRVFAAGLECEGSGDYGCVIFQPGFCGLFWIGVIMKYQKQWE